MRTHTGTWVHVLTHTHMCLDIHTTHAHMLAFTNMGSHTHSHTNIRPLLPTPSVCCFDICRPHAPQVGSLAQTRSQALHLPGYPRNPVAMTIMFPSWDSWDPDSSLLAAPHPQHSPAGPYPAVAPGLVVAIKACLCFSNQAELGAGHCTLRAAFLQAGWANAHEPRGGHGPTTPDLTRPQGSPSCGVCPRRQGKPQAEGSGVFEGEGPGVDPKHAHVLPASSPQLSSLANPCFARLTR